ncbi:MAG: efflux RND transporter periplasmic adaptor subunit [Desulfobacterales bacterium]
MSDRSRRHRLFIGSVKGLGVLALLILLMLWLSGIFLGKVKPGPPEARPKPPRVASVRVELREFPLIAEQVGTVRSRTQARIASRIMAQVKEISVHEGSRVEASGTEGDDGTLLATLDDREIQARLHQVRSQVEAADRAIKAAKSRLDAAIAQREAAQARKRQSDWEYQHYEDLYRQKAATGQQLQQIRAHKDVTEAQVQAAGQEVKAASDDVKRLEAQLQQAQAAELEARTMLSYAVIRAPFSGRVTRKMVDVGDMVAPGQHLFLLDVPAQPQLHAYIAESLITHLQPGQVLKVEIEALSATLEGTIEEIVPLAEPASRTTLVKIALTPMPALVTGLYGRVDIPYGIYRSLVVPMAAVREVGQLHLVTVLDVDGYPHRRFVTLGRRHDDLVEVLTGLQEGEEVTLP